jgi:Subtilisin inhibitor-like
VACAALAACSGGSAGSSPSAGGTAASASGSTPGSTATSTSAAGTTSTTAPGVTTTVPSGAPILPSRKGSPPIPWDTAAARNAPRVTSIPSAASGPANLRIVLDDGTGIRSTWTLRCDPAGGNHPDPSRACGVLGANGAKALPATPADQVCTQIYGGPQKALLEGTWRGKPVKSQFTLENGCETSRWTLMLGLLPPGGLP